MGELLRVEGNLVAAGMRLGVVTARWNGLIVDRLVDGALEAISRHGGELGNVTFVKVPGCFELPIVVRQMATSGKYDAIIALGALIKGETDHYDHVGSVLVSGIGAISQQYGVPVTYGVVAADNMAQAIDRAGGKAGNKGWEAAVAAIETVNVLRALGGACSGETNQKTD